VATNGPGAPTRWGHIHFFGKSALLESEMHGPTQGEKSLVRFSCSAKTRVARAALSGWRIEALGVGEEPQASSDEPRK
jgi:hypothetical protein